MAPLLPPTVHYRGHGATALTPKQKKVDTLHTSRVVTSVKVMTQKQQKGSVWEKKQFKHYVHKLHTCPFGAHF